MNKVFEYAYAMKRGDKFPPVHVEPELFHGLILGVHDGAHRTAAAKLARMGLFAKIATINKEMWEERLQCSITIGHGASARIR